MARIFPKNRCRLPGFAPSRYERVFWEIQDYKLFFIDPVTGKKVRELMPGISTERPTGPSTSTASTTPPAVTTPWFAVRTRRVAKWPRN
jgi:hypothetical protein